MAKKHGKSSRHTHTPGHKSNLHQNSTSRSSSSNHVRSSGSSRPHRSSSSSSSSSSSTPSATSSSRVRDDLVQTGIPGMDPLIFGGLERNSTTIIKGGAGSGKTIFSTQFLHAGCTKYNENGAFISFLEPRESVLTTAKKFGWDLDQLENKGVFQFIQYSPQQVQDTIKDAGGVLRDTLEALDAKRVVIDSLTAYTLIFKNDYDMNQGVLDFMGFLRSCKCTALVTEECEVAPCSTEKSRLSFLSEGLIKLYHLRKDYGKYRALEIVKMRHSNHSDRIHLFNIGDAGISVHPPVGIFDFSLLKKNQ